MHIKNLREVGLILLIHGPNCQLIQYIYGVPTDVPGSRIGARDAVVSTTKSRPRGAEADSKQ